LAEMQRAALALVFLAVSLPTTAGAHSTRHRHRHKARGAHHRRRTPSTPARAALPRRAPPAIPPNPQAPATPALEPADGEPQPPAETPTEEAEQAEGVRELCADAGLASAGVNTPEELALDYELRQSCAESGLG